LPGDLLVGIGIWNTVSKHHADSRSIMVFACFLRVFDMLRWVLPAEFVGFQHFNLDIHRANAAD